MLYLFLDAVAVKAQIGPVLISLNGIISRDYAEEKVTKLVFKAKRELLRHPFLIILEQSHLAKI
jgi:hypothetical protein